LIGCRRSNGSRCRPVVCAGGRSRCRPARSRIRRSSSRGCFCRSSPVVPRVVIGRSSCCGYRCRRSIWIRERRRRRRCRRSSAFVGSRGIVVGPHGTAGSRGLSSSHCASSAASHGSSARRSISRRWFRSSVYLGNISRRWFRRRNGSVALIGRTGGHLWVCRTGGRWLARWGFGSGFPLRGSGTPVKVVVAAVAARHSFAIRNKSSALVLFMLILFSIQN